MFNKIAVSLWLFFVGSTSIVFFIINIILKIITSSFDKKLKILQQVTCFWASLYTWIVPNWKIVPVDRKKIRSGATYMVVSNHQSQLDILTVFNLFFHFKFVSKAEIFKIPLIGWNMSLNNYIKLKRGNKKSIQKMMNDCEARLSEGSSVFFFPEGTRSLDGIVKPFKPGAFILAHKMKVPILPLVISGTNRALPKYSMDFHKKQKIIIKVLDEIPYEKYANLSVAETADMVREIIIENLNELNKITHVEAK